MTLQEAATILGLSKNTLQVQAKRGKLRAVKHGRDWWVTEAEVARYATEHKGKGQPK